jgi:hypothetical protein
MCCLNVKKIILKERVSNPIYIAKDYYHLLMVQTKKLAKSVSSSPDYIFKFQFRRHLAHASTFTVLLMLFFPGILFSQLSIIENDTAICSGSVTFNATVQNASVPTNVSLSDDIHSGVVNIGFSFNYYGSNYTQCVISSNNYITFNLANANTASPWQITNNLPNAGSAALHNAILAPWQDINPGGGGNIRYTTIGVAPNRIFVVEYCNIPMFSCSSLQFSSQIQLFENGNKIQTHIISKPLCSTWNGGQAIHGVQNNGGTQATIVPGRNAGSQWTATNEGREFLWNGTTYTQSIVPFAPLILGNLNNIQWTEVGSSTVLGTGASITVTPAATTSYVASVIGGCTSIPFTDTVQVFVGARNFENTDPLILCSDDPVDFANDLILTATTNTDSVFYILVDDDAVLLEYFQFSPSFDFIPGSYCIYAITYFSGYDTILPVPDGIITLSDLISAITAETGICVSISETCKPVNIYPSAQILISQDTFSACPGSSVQVIVGVDEPLDESICGQVISCDNPEVLQPIGPTGAPGFTQAYSNSVRARMQVIYTQAELIGLGVEPGQVIASIGFRTLALSSTGFDGYEDYTIKVGCTNLSSLEGGYIGDLTTVFSEDIVLAADSWNVHVFDSPYYWDGTSNLVVEVCYTNPSQPKNAAVWGMAGGGDQMRFASSNFGTTPGCILDPGFPIMGSAKPLPRFTVCPEPNQYIWTPATGLSCTDCPDPMISPAETTTYTVVVNDGYGCYRATKEITVEIITPDSVDIQSQLCIGSTYELPTNPGQIVTVSGDTVVYHQIGCDTVYVYELLVYDLITGGAVANTPLCVGATLNLSGSGGVGYAWSGPGGFSSTDQSPQLVDVGLAASGEYTVTITDANGCSIEESVTVQVNANPPQAAANNGPLCVGEELTLSSGGGNTYSWSGPGGFTGSGMQVNIPAVTSAMAGTYTVTITNASGCTSVGSTQVSINSSPIITATSTTPAVCTGGQINLSSTGGVTYSWSGPGGFSSGVSSPVISSASVANSGAYTVVVTDVNGCTSSASVTVIVNEAQAPVISGLLSLCEGSDLSLSSSTAVNYSWSGPGGISGTGQDLSIPSVTSAQSGQYSVTITDANGCTSSTSVTVNVSPLPVLSVSPDQTVCAGTNVILSVSGAQSYAWSGPGGYVNTGGTITIPGASVAQSGVYTVVGTNANGCTGQASVTLEVNPSPAATATGPSMVCPGSSFTLEASGGVTYSWSSPGGESSTAPTLTIPSASTIHNGLFEVTVTDVNGCSAVAGVMVNLYAEPQGEVTGNSPVCEGGTILLSSSGGVSYSWAGPGGFSQSAANVSIPNGSITNAGEYTVTITDVNGCTVSESIQVAVNPNPEPTAGNNSPVCAGSPVQLSVSGSWSQVVWSGPGGYGSTVPAAVIPNAGLTSGGIYTAVVTDVNGCTGAAETTVEVNPLPTATALSDAVCEGEDIILSATGGQTYAWSGPGGFTSNNQTVVLSNPTTVELGTYTVTVTDNTGCTAEASVQAAFHPALSANLVTIPTLPAQSSGSVSINIASGAAPLSYSWSNGASTQNISGLPPGIYTVTITDVNGCSLELSAEVEEVECETVVLFSIDSIECFGSTNGSVTTQISGGTAPYQINWSTGDTGTTISGLSAGVYGVTVTDAAGCVQPTAVTISQPAAITATNSLTQLSCYESGDGQISLTASGGTGALAYAWSNGAQTQGLTNIPAGNYTLTITDSKACTAEFGPFEITQPDSLYIELVSQSNVLCYGDSTGSVEVSVFGGIAVFSYAWSSGGDSSGVTGLAAGAHSLTVTDANGCTATFETTITEPDPISITPTINASLPEDSTGSISLIIDGGQSPYSAVWSNTATTQNISDLPAGNYFVTITDANGCTTEFGPLEVPEIDCEFTVSISMDSISCPGGSDGSLTAQIGGIINPPISFIWSTGDTTATIENLPEGIYTVTVTDGLGCTFAISADVDAPQPISATETIEHVACYNGLDGQINMDISGGTAPYNYAWSNGDIAPNLSIVGAGNYTLTITDAKACTAEFGPFEITQPDSLYIELVSQSNVLCYGDSTGSVEVSVVGGVAVFSYAWSSGGDSSGVTGLAAATHSLTVTDANGCTATFETTITQPDPISITPSINASLPEDSTGSISLIIDGGESPYSAVWSNTATTQNISDLPAGNYFVTITDANGCTTEFGPLEVPEIDCEFLVSIEIDSISCAGGSDGSLTAVVSGIINPPISFIWSTGDTTATIENLPEGIYTVTVTDGLGCTFAISADVDAPQPISATETIEHVACYNGLDGQINMDISGGTAPYNYAWSNGDIAPNLSIVGAGNYTLTITDAKACTAEFGPFEITQPDSLYIELVSQSNVLCYGDSTGSVEVSVFGGVAVFSYAWSSGGDSSEVTGLAAGTHSLTVTDSNGCTATFETTITEPDPISITPTINGSLPEDSTGAISLIINGGESPYDAIWSNGQQTIDVSEIPTGNYFVTITDANGCTAEFGPLEVPEIDCAFEIELQTEAISCSYTADGSITAALIGTAIEPVTFLWNSGETGATQMNLSAGSYTVTVTDGLGCTSSATATLTAPDPQNAITETTPVTCHGASDGQISLTAEGGTGELTFLWSNGAVTQGLTNVPAGLYSVTMTDENNCTAEFGPFEVTQPDELLLTINLLADAGCYLDSTGYIVAVASGGSGTIGFAWNTGDTTTELTNLGAGIYTVTATDENGCEAIQSIEVESFEGSIDTLFAISCEPDTEPLEAIFANQFGCDSVIVTIFEFVAPSIDTIELTTCNPVEAGVVVDSLFGIAGCDSITVTITTLELLDTTYLFLNACDESDSGLFTDILVTSAGCDSVVVTEVTYIGSDTTYLESATCNPSDAGTFTEVFDNQFGCDSVIITEVELLPSQFEQITEFSCNPLDLGVETFTYVNQYGCDSIIEVTTLFTSDGIQYETVEIDLCPGGVYDGMAYTSPATVIETYTGANGCDSIVTVNISIYAPPVPQISGVLQVCGSNNGTTTSLSGTAGFVSYQWSNGSSNSEITVGAGTYTLTVTDENGCTGTVQATVTAFNPINLNMVGANNMCTANAANAQVFASGGAGGYTYLWSNGATTSLINGLPSGIYQVTVTDSFGCTASNSVTVQSIENPPSVSLTTEDATCYGLENGNLTSTVSGGYPPYTYLWNTGATTPDLENIPAGIYTLYVVDQQGCTAISLEEVDQPFPLEVDLEIIPAHTGQNNGSVIAHVYGGTPDYSYSWTTGSTATSIFNLAPGNYSVTVTDANGCTVENSAAVTIYTHTDLPDFVESLNLFPNPNDGRFSLEVSFNESLDTELSIYDLSGRIVLQKQWYASHHTTHIELDVPAGMYLMRINTVKGLVWLRVVVR